MSTILHFHFSYDNSYNTWRNASRMDYVHAASKLLEFCFESSTDSLLQEKLIDKTSIKPQNHNIIKSRWNKYMYPSLHGS
jgi:glutathionylspermidine synthase